jgi:CheY-like chemotaxis protein
MADSLQLEQVLMNLATNAKDAMQGGGTITITTGVAELDLEFVRASGYGRPGPHCLISFSDTGTGMDERTKARIFEPFFTTKEPGKGTGLGLSVVYGIVRQHSGFINVYSEPGRGSTFRIYLPLVKAPAEAAPTRAETPAPAGGGGETILLAEDSKDIRDLLKGTLEGAGYRVIAAEDGEEAIAAFRAHRDEVALLLLDVVMPKADGREVLEEARRVAPGVRAILMSGYAGEILGEADLKKEGVAFVQKPLHLKDVLSTIRAELDRGKAQ